METKQEIKQENTNKNMCSVFVESILTRHENALIRAKDTSNKQITMEYTPIELGFCVGVEKIRISYTREHINKIVAGLLGVSVDTFKKEVIQPIEQNNAFGTYNQEVKKLLKENKQLIKYK